MRPGRGAEGAVSPPDGPRPRPRRAAPAPAPAGSTARAAPRARPRRPRPWRLITGPICCTILSPFGKAGSALTRPRRALARRSSDAQPSAGRYLVWPPQPDGSRQSAIVVAAGGWPAQRRAPRRVPAPRATRCASCRHAVAAGVASATGLIAEGRQLSRRTYNLFSIIRHFCNPIRSAPLPALSPTGVGSPRSCCSATNDGEPAVVRPRSGCLRRAAPPRSPTTPSSCGRATSPASSRPGCSASASSCRSPSTMSTSGCSRMFPAGR